MNETEKNIKKVDNSSYRERFQFQLQVNDNIICQRYFKIPYFNNDSIASEELTYTLQYVVDMIKEDLKSKSRIYVANTCGETTKLTGFASKTKALKEARENGASQAEIVDIVRRKEDDETHVYHTPKVWDETEFVKEWEVTFKFSFMVDERPVYEEIWDGSCYPKYVRNSVDITNSKSPYPMVQLMNLEKPDLVVKTISEICSVCSNGDGENERKYTKKTKQTVKKNTTKK